MKTLELECDEIADLKMMRDDLGRLKGAHAACYPPPDRRLSLINKILDHAMEGRPRVHGMHQIR